MLVIQKRDGSLIFRYVFDAVCTDLWNVLSDQTSVRAVRKSCGIFKKDVVIYLFCTSGGDRSARILLQVTGVHLSYWMDYIIVMGLVLCSGIIFDEDKKTVDKAVYLEESGERR